MKFRQDMTLTGKKYSDNVKGYLKSQAPNTSKTESKLDLYSDNLLQ